MFGSLANGTTRITHFLEGADCLSTISCFRKMGIDIDRNGDEILSYTAKVFTDSVHRQVSLMSATAEPRPV